MRSPLALIVAPFLLAAAPPKAESLPIGKVMWGIKGGTGFMIDRCQLVTARHAAPDRALKVGAPFRFKIYGMQRRATVVAFGQGEMAYGGTERAADWLVARLDRCLPEGTPVFQLFTGPIVNSPYFHNTPSSPAMAGFLGRRRNPITRPSCPIKAQTRDGSIEVGCWGMGGMSGGPLFVRLETGQLLALGITSTADRKASLSWATPLSGVVATAPGSTFAESPSAALSPISNSNPTWQDGNAAARMGPGIRPASEWQGERKAALTLTPLGVRTH